MSSTRRHAVSFAWRTKKNNQICFGHRLDRSAIDWLFHLAIDHHVHAQHLVHSTFHFLRLVSLVGKLCDEMQSIMCGALIYSFIDDLLTFLFLSLSRSDSISRPHQGQPLRVTIQDLFAHLSLQSSSILHVLCDSIDERFPRILHQLLDRLWQSHDTNRRSEANLEW